MAPFKEGVVYLDRTWREHFLVPLPPFHPVLAELSALYVDIFFGLKSHADNVRMMCR